MLYVLDTAACRILFKFQLQWLWRWNLMLLLYRTCGSEHGSSLDLDEIHLLLYNECDSGYLRQAEQCKAVVYGWNTISLTLNDFFFKACYCQLCLCLPCFATGEQSRSVCGIFWKYFCLSWNKRMYDYIRGLKWLKLNFSAGYSIV